MDIFRRQRDPLRLFFKRVLILGMLVLAGVIASGVWGVYKKERDSRALRVESGTQLADLEQRRDQLGEDIASLKTDRGLEEALREQYQLAKSGEKLIVIVEPSEPKPEEKSSPVMEWFNEVFSWW